MQVFAADERDAGMEVGGEGGRRYECVYNAQ